MNLFKSLGGSSFCSQEHQKLYEEAEANKGLERLLQFVEKDPKSGPSKPVVAPASSPFTKPDKQEAIPVPPTAPGPPAAPVPQTIAAREPDPILEPRAPEHPEAEPPIAGFLLEPIAPAVTNSGSINPNFEILEAGFPAEPAALPSYRFAVAAADHQQPADGAPPPLASWLDPVLSATDVPAITVEVPSVGSVRPRAMALAMPSPDNLALAPVAPPLVCSGDASGLQLAIQAVLDTRGYRNLARLNPLLREVRTSIETPQWPATKSVVPALSRPDALELNATPEAKAGTGLTIGMTEAALAQQLPVAPGTSAVPHVIPTVQSRRDALQLHGLSKAMAGIGVTLGMSGAMTRTGVGRNVSAPAALAPKLLVTLGTSQVHGTILARVQDTRNPGQPAIPRSRLEPKISQAPAQPPRGAAGLPGRSFATLKVDQADQAGPIDMNGAMTRAGLAKAVRQPQAQASRLVSALGSIEVLKRVTAGVQNAPHPPACAILPAMRAPRECVQPVGPLRPEAPAGIASVIVPMNLTIRESGTPLAVGITNAKKPADVSSPLFIPNAPSSRRSFTIGMNRIGRKIPAQVQAEDGSRGCTIAPARQPRRECLLPAILWSAETWLRSAIASVGWFHASNCSSQAFPSGAPATRLFSIRFEPEPFSMDAPALGFDRLVRMLTLNVCECKTGLAAKEQEALRLERSQPARTSPLALVTKPKPLVTRLAVRYIGNLNQFTSIANPAARGVAPSAAASASADEHQPIIALPPLAASGLTSAFRLLSPAALKSAPVEPAEHKNTEAGSRPRPSPLRVQPASMLVLPGLSIPVGGIRWRASGGWATVASPSLPKQGDVQVSSSAETSLSSLRFLAGALRVDSAVTQEFAALQLNPKPPSLSLDLGAQTSAPGVPAANALPRRGGPKLPVVTAQLDDLIVAGR